MSKAAKAAKELEEKTESLMTRTKLALRLLEELWELMVHCEKARKKASVPIQGCQTIMKMMVKDLNMVRRMLAVEDNLLRTDKQMEGDIANLEKNMHTHAFSSKLKGLLDVITEEAKKEGEYIRHLHQCLQYLHQYTAAKELFPETTSHKKHWTRASLHYSKNIVEIVETLQEEASLPAKVNEELHKSISVARENLKKHMSKQQSFDAAA